MSKINRSHLILKKAFNRQKKNNPKFSIRALALKLGISHVFLMKILKGYALVPEKKVVLIIKHMGLDDLAIAEFKEALLLDILKEKANLFPKDVHPQKNISVGEFDELPMKDFSLLNQWYDLPILELLTCQLEDYTTKTIAKKLSLSPHEVEISINKMLDLGLINKNGNQWIKTNKKIRFPMKRPSDVTKNYYEKVLKKAITEVHDIREERYEKRSITNLSIAVNPKKIQIAKEKLQKALYEIAEELSDGECSEVYFLTTCLYPLSCE